MTETQPADGSDPLYDWLAVRLEQFAADEPDLETSSHEPAQADLLEEAGRAAQCAEILAAVWPANDNPAAETEHPTDAPQHLEDQNGNPVVNAAPELGRFQIQRLLGRGGMGNVFLAFDPVLERSVALKVPRFDGGGDPDLKERFLLEARAAAKLSHPNLVEVYDAGLDGAVCYIASAYCDGPDLANWLAARKQPVEPQLAARLIARLAEAIHCCHEIGIIHRDLKPANILLASTANEMAAAQNGMPFVPKITDFGLARAVEESLIQTRSSLLVGTPLYMAPEQADARPDQVGPATDVFALGAILYEVLTGRPPFEGRSTLTVLSRIQSEDPPLPSQLRQKLPAGLDAICMKCLRKRPDERYTSAAALAADLENWLGSRPLSARRFTVRDRFRTWSRQPERLRDAGAVSIGWNGVIALSLLFHIVTLVLGIQVPLPVDTSGKFLRECLVVMSVHLAVCWVGWRIIRGDRWAFRVGFAAAVLLWMGTANALFGGSAMFHMYEDFPTAKYLMMLTFTLFSTAQLFVFLVALRASPRD